MNLKNSFLQTDKLIKALNMLPDEVVLVSNVSN